jgi:hypothetical protein
MFIHRHSESNSDKAILSSLLIIIDTDSASLSEREAGDRANSGSGRDVTPPTPHPPEAERIKHVECRLGQ